MVHELQEVEVTVQNSNADTKSRLSIDDDDAAHSNRVQS